MYPKTLAGGEFPFNVSVEGTDIYSSGNINTLGEVIDVFQRTLDTIKDGAHDAWTELHRKRFSCPEHRITNGHTSFITLLRKTTLEEFIK